MSLKAAACAAAFLSAGCGDRQPAPPAATSAPLLEWTSARELPIRLFSRRDRFRPEITGIAVRGDTVVFALHPKEQLVREFTPTGGIRDTINGPRSGENFSQPTRIGLLGNLLWVYDAGKNRVAKFDRDNKLVAEITLSLEKAGQGATFESLLSGDEVLAHLPLPGDSLQSNYALVRFGPGKPDTLFHLHDRDRWLRVKSAAPIANPLAQQTLVAVSATDNSIVLAEPPAGEHDHEWRLTKINTAGDTIFSKRIPYDPRPLTPVIAKQIAARLHAQPPGSTVPAEAMEQALLQSPDLPAVSGLIVAVDGTILVRGSEEEDQTVKWTIVTPNGELRATQRTPAATHFMAAGGPFFFGFELDADTIATLARYRVVAQ